MRKCIVHDVYMAAIVIARHEVKDFDAWNRVFQSVAAMRKEGGEKSAQVYRDVDDAHIIVGIFEWRDIETARTFFGKAELKVRMLEAGVIGGVALQFLEGV
jgi:quinol monooxygenase YgiN